MIGSPIREIFKNEYWILNIGIMGYVGLATCTWEEYNPLRSRSHTGDDDMIATSCDVITALRVTHIWCDHAWPTLINLIPMNQFE